MSYIDLACDGPLHGEQLGWCVVPWEPLGVDGEVLEMMVVAKEVEQKTLKCSHMIITS